MKGSICPLEEAADALLAEHERDPERPWYTTANFARKLRASNARASRSAVADGSEAADLLMRRQLADLAGKARLTCKQSQVVGHRLFGDSLVEIAKLYGYTKQCAFVIFSQAVRRLRRALKDDPYFGIEEVYRAEVRRFAPSRMGRRRK
jgi:hypothetical protein